MHETFERSAQLDAEQRFSPPMSGIAMADSPRVNTESEVLCDALEKCVVANNQHIEHLLYSLQRHDGPETSQPTEKTSDPGPISGTGSRLRLLVATMEEQNLRIAQLIQRVNEII